MTKKQFNVALAQYKPVAFDKTVNLLKARDIMEQAAKQQAGLIIFPEMFLSDYLVWDRLDTLAEPVSGKSIKVMSDLAKEFGLVTVCGFPEKNPGHLPYNSACVIDSDGTLVGVYRKTHLFCEEKKHFTPGSSIPVFETSIGKVGIMICYDSEFPEVARLLALAGAEIIAMPTANMEPYGECQSIYLRARALENGIFIATCNLVGVEGNFNFFGQSALVNPSGEFLCLGGSGEQLLIGGVDLSARPEVKDCLAYIRDRRPDLYTGITDNSKR